MNRTRISLTAALLSLCLFLSGCMMPPAEGTAASFSLEDIPAYAGDPYVAIDGNQPDFPEEDQTSTESFETYSPLDALGRCGVGKLNPADHIADGIYAGQACLEMFIYQNSSPLCLYLLYLWTALLIKQTIRPGSSACGDENSVRRNSPRTFFFAETAGQACPLFFNFFHPSPCVDIHTPLF